MVFPRAQIFQVTRRKVINYHYAFAIAQQPLHEVRADEARAASDEREF